MVIFIAIVLSCALIVVAFLWGRRTAPKKPEAQKSYLPQNFVAPTSESYLRSGSAPAHQHDWKIVAVGYYSNFTVFSQRSAVEAHKNGLLVNPTTRLVEKCTGCGDVRARMVDGELSKAEIEARGIYPGMSVTVRGGGGK